ncbi:hypothetical protein NDW01_25175 [Actinoallomurus sp. WRP6H-15]|nr:hypothetical protein [Actinoallomurus soli]
MKRRVRIRRDSMHLKKDSMHLKKIVMLFTVATAATVGTATAVGAVPEPEHGRPEVASVAGTAQVRLTYLADKDIRTFSINAHGVPYTHGPVPGADGRTLPGSPNDATGTVKISHYSAERNTTYTAVGRVDSLMTAPGVATLTAVITQVSPGGPPWVGMRLGFSVYDGGKDAPGHSRDRVGFSWEYADMVKHDGMWGGNEAEIGTSMAPAPFAPVTEGGFTVEHADLLPLPSDTDRS